MNNNKSSAAYSAPSSIVLSGMLGERYGKPLLVCAIEYRVTCAVEEIADKPASYLYSVPVIEKEVKFYLNRKMIPFQVSPYQFRVTKSDFMDVDDNGSSTFITAATACLLDFYAHLQFDPEVVNSLAFSIEKKLRRTAFGYSTSSSSMGGIIYARREFEFLKILSKLPFKITSGLQEHMYIGQLSATLSEEISRRLDVSYNNSPLKMEKILAEFEKNTRKLTVAIAGANQSLFHAALKSDEAIWKTFNVLNSSLKKIAVEIPSQDAVSLITMGQKPALLFFSTDKKRLKFLAEKYSVRLLPFRLSNQGLKKVKV